MSSSSPMSFHGATAASIDSWATSLREHNEENAKSGSRDNEARWRHACQELDIVRKETICMRQKLSQAEDRCHRFGLYVVARVRDIASS